MNTLRLGNINLHAPYKVMQDPERHIYLAETGDRKQAFRNRLFVRWFNIYERREFFYMKTAEGKMDGIMNFLAIISRKDNPNLPQAIAEFDETISFLFDPPEESA